MRPSVLYVVTEPWYFANHRLDHAKALIDDGFEVHVATRAGDRWEEVVESGCHLHEIDISRGDGGVRSWYHEVFALRRLVREVAPSVIHAVALKPAALCLALVVMRRRPALILAINGLGISATRSGRRLGIVRSVLHLAVRLPRVTLLFQTEADRRAMLGGGRRGCVIPGVGVDTLRFRPGAPPQPPPVVVVYLGRAVRSKGLLELARALETQQVPNVELRVYCSLDHLSPGSLTTSEFAVLTQAPGLTVHAPTTAPEDVLSGAHAAILPSLAGEGVSKFVLEALASGVPVLVSSQSGSAEVVEDGHTGLAFDVRDPASIRSALERVANLSPASRDQFERQARATAVERYSLDVILPQIVALHREASGRQ